MGEIAAALRHEARLGERCLMGRRGDGAVSRKLRQVPLDNREIRPSSCRLEPRRLSRSGDEMSL
jgi:hypothetical protein